MIGWIGNALLVQPSISAHWIFFSIFYFNFHYFFFKYETIVLQSVQNSSNFWPNIILPYFKFEKDLHFLVEWSIWIEK